MKKIWLIAFVIILIDQITKIYIKTNFEYYESVEVLSWFQLRFIENPGMAYGVELGGEIGKIALTIIRLFLISFAIAFLHKKIQSADSWYIKVPVAMLLAGAIGNLIDSMFYGLMFDQGLVYNDSIESFTRESYNSIAQLDFSGYAGLFSGCVVDMLYFPMIDTILPDWVPFIGGDKFVFFNPIFNVADASITGGIIIFTLIYLFKRDKFPKDFNL